MCSAKRHVRFTPESGHVRCTRYVRFVPIADIAIAKWDLGGCRPAAPQVFVHRGQSPDATPQRSVIIVAVFILFIVVVIVICTKPLVMSYADEIGGVVRQT